MGEKPSDLFPLFDVPEDLTPYRGIRITSGMVEKWEDIAFCRTGGGPVVYVVEGLKYASRAEVEKSVEKANLISRLAGESEEYVREMVKKVSPEMVGMLSMQTVLLMLPALSDGQRVKYHNLKVWSDSGLSGVRLVATRNGCHLFTTKANLLAFAEAVTSRPRQKAAKFYDVLVEFAGRAVRV